VTMAQTHEDNKHSLSEESKGLTHGELIRDYEPQPNTVWRFGKPNYAKVNKTYFELRTRKHVEGSLEATVSKMIKNWEVEAHHIADIHQWQTMDITKFTAALNGGCPCSAQLMAGMGHHNVLVGETKSYSSKAQSFTSADALFKNVFPDGFAWEVLEVYSGPPVISFKWRHFSKYTGTYTDKDGKVHKGNDKPFDLIGMCLCKVNEELKIESIDVYYNPNDMIEPLMT
jgi:hypothetical protein